MKLVFGQGKLTILDKIIFYLRKNKIKKYLKSKLGVVVDFGCGFKMSFLEWLTKKIKVDKVIGIDLAINKVLLDDKLIPLVADLNKKIPLPDETVDLIVSLAILEHLNEPEINLKEAYRLLKIGGLLFMTTPSPKAKIVLNFLSWLGLISREEIKDHKNYFNKNSLKKMLFEAGFDKEKIKIEYFMLGFNNLVVAYK